MFLDPMLTSVASMVSYPSSTMSVAPTLCPRSLFPGSPKATTLAKPLAQGLVVANPASFRAQSDCEVYKLNRGPVTLLPRGSEGGSGGLKQGPGSLALLSDGCWKLGVRYWRSRSRERRLRNRGAGFRIGAELDRWMPIAGRDLLLHRDPPSPLPAVIISVAGEKRPVPAANEPATAVTAHPPAVTVANAKPSRPFGNGRESLKVLLPRVRSTRDGDLEGPRLEALLEASLLWSL